MRRAILIILSSLLLFITHATAMEAEHIDEPGIWATYLTPAQLAQSTPPILFIGGSDGGIPVQSASLFQDLGFRVLAVGYFSLSRDGVPESVPSQFDRIPLEFIKNAIAWLNQKFPGEDIAVVAGSKGAEAFLAFASTGDESLLLVKKVILRSGTCCAFEGLLEINGGRSTPSGHSAWTFNNEEVPYVIYDRRPKFHFFRRWRPRLQMELAAVYKESIEKADKSGALEQAMFTLNHLDHADMMFISGAKDKLWPSSSMMRRLLNRHPDKQNIEYVCLEHAGHSLFETTIDNDFIMLGKTNDEACRSAVESVMKVLKRS